MYNDFLLYTLSVSFCDSDDSNIKLAAWKRLCKKIVTVEINFV